MLASRAGHERGCRVPVRESLRFALQRLPGRGVWQLRHEHDVIRQVPFGKGAARNERSSSALTTAVGRAPRRERSLLPPGSNTATAAATAAGHATNSVLMSIERIHSPPDLIRSFLRSVMRMLFGVDSSMSRCGTNVVDAPDVGAA